MSTASYAEQLLQQQAVAAVWSLNYLGYSTLHALNRLGIRCQVLRYKEGQQPETLRDVDGFSAVSAHWCSDALAPRPLPRADLVETLPFPAPDEAIARALVHFIGPPGVEGGAPSNRDLMAAAKALCRGLARGPRHPPLLIVESYTAPNTALDIVQSMLARHELEDGRDYLLCAAPRRDWLFEDFERRRFPRLAGAGDERARREARAVLGLFHGRVEMLESPLAAEVAINFEYASAHVLSVLCAQLVEAYPTLDIARIIAALDTRVLTEALGPRLLPIGYMTNSAGDYLIEGAQTSTSLSLLREALASQFRLITEIADALAARGVTRVGLLGCSSLVEQPVPLLSPAGPVAHLLESRKMRVVGHDPFYPGERLRDNFGLTPFAFPDEMESLDALVLLVDHWRYRAAPPSLLSAFLQQPRRVIVDSPGVWESPALRDTPGLYCRVGGGRMP